MTYYLIVYERWCRNLVDLQEFEDADDAVRARFRIEADPHSEDLEVVVLGAESREALQRTHSRYFDVEPELAGVN